MTSAHAIFFLAVLTTLVACQQSQQQQATTTISKPFSNVRNLFPSRLTFTGKVIDPKFDPNGTDYLQSLGVLSLFGAFCLAFTFVWSCLFPTIRQMGCCGGAAPMIGCFRGQLRKKPYPAWQVIICKLLTFVLLGIVVVIAAFGFFANDTVNKGIETSRFTIRDTSNTLLNKTIELRDTMIQLIELQGNATNPAIEVVRDSLNTVLSSQQNQTQATKNIVRDVGRANKVRFGFLTLVFIFSILMPLLLVMAAIGNFKMLNEFVLSFGFYIVLIAWACYTLHFVLAFASGDFCAAADEYVSSRNDAIRQPNVSSVFFNSNTKAVFDLIVNCNNNVSLVPTLQFSEQNVQDLVAQFNALLDENDKPFKHSYNESTLDDALQLPAVQANATLRAQLTQAIFLVRSYANIIRKIISLTNCQFIAEGFAVIRNAACVDALGAIDLLWVVFLLLGLAEFVVVNVGFLTFKRFRKRKFVVPTPSKNHLVIALPQK